MRYNNIYIWFDWFIYINILLEQVDMVIIEICTDLLMYVITTTYYVVSMMNPSAIKANKYTR